MKWIVSLVIAVLLVTGGWSYWRVKSKPATAFRTEAVTRGDLVPNISATGTVEPQEVVDVGAQVAGRIISFGTDDKGKMIDYGSPVEAGTVLALIDDTLYQADASNATASLAQAKAGVTKAVADLAQAHAKLEQAQSDWERAQKLGEGDALSQSDYNTYKAAFDTAKANVGVGEAVIEQAKAAVTQAEAMLKRSTQNLGYCTISSPVKGVIIDRRVNIGETVVSSLNTPSLFLIAKDLRQIQVWVSVNEADIGNIHPGQPVTFRVDAYPTDAFHGSVGKVRLNASMTQNVVTYTVEVNTDNSDGRLLPYLSANVKFEISNHSNVVLVPNSALRWYPEVAMVSPSDRDAVTAEAQKDADKGASESGATTRPAHNGHAESQKPSHGTVWVVDGKYVRPIKVRIGVSDSIVTELLDDSLHEGDELVEGVEDTAAVDTTTNPFAPQMFRNRKR